MSLNAARQRMVTFSSGEDARAVADLRWIALERLSEGAWFACLVGPITSKNTALKFGVHRSMDRRRVHAFLPMSAPHLNTRSQFAHLSMAAPVGGRSKRTGERKWSAAELVAEADRLHGHARHVANPLPPAWLVGSAGAVLSRAAQWHAQAREAGGRAKRRRTSPSLACAVVSWPDKREPEWRSYRNEVIAYFKRKLGADRMPGVAEHRDESHFHIHIYFVPKDNEDFAAVHPGYGARAVARRLPGNRVGKAFVEAMKTWQDDLHAATGVRFGLERASVRRLRQTRMEYKVRVSEDKAKAQAKQVLEEAQAQAEALIAEARMKLELVRRQAKTLNIREEKLKVLAAAVQSERHKFAMEPVGQHKAEVDRLAGQNGQLSQRLAEVEKKLDAERFRQRAREAENSRVSPSTGPKSG